MHLQTIDLFDSNADCIAQQCNCVTIKPHGLAASIAAKYAFADLYGKRIGRTANCATAATQDVPGSCILAKPPANVSGPVVACLMGQIAPGKPGGWSKKYSIQPCTDTAAQRLEYFKSALDELANACKIEKWSTVAFPYQIGCGLAGGSWPQYSAMLESFAQDVAAYGVSVIVCQRKI